MLKDVPTFREAVNAAMNVDDLRRALVIHQWLAVTEVEADEEEPSSPSGSGSSPGGEPTHAVAWVQIQFSVEELRRVAVLTTLFLETVVVGRSVCCWVGALACCLLVHR